LNMLILSNKNWGLGIGDWGLPNPQSPIPNPQSPISKVEIKYYLITHNFFKFNK